MIPQNVAMRQKHASNVEAEILLFEPLDREYFYVIDLLFGLRLLIWFENSRVETFVRCLFFYVAQQLVTLLNKNF